MIKEIFEKVTGFLKVLGADVVWFILEEKLPETLERLEAVSGPMGQTVQEWKHSRETADFQNKIR